MTNISVSSVQITFLMKSLASIETHEKKWKTNEARLILSRKRYFIIDVAFFKSISRRVPRANENIKRSFSSLYRRPCIPVNTTNSELFIATNQNRGVRLIIRRRVPCHRVVDAMWRRNSISYTEWSVSDRDSTSRKRRAQVENEFETDRVDDRFT